MGSYRYWERELGRDDFTFGQFGENFTVEGLADDPVCIGDRYAIGSASLRGHPARVTCYRVAIRIEDPRIPALLVSHRRPGFYFRVSEEGEVEAGAPGNAGLAATSPPPAWPGFRTLAVTAITPEGDEAISIRLEDPAGTAVPPAAAPSCWTEATPVLAMLQALARDRSQRPVRWLHGARDGAQHAFAAEARALLAELPHAEAHVFYSRPRPADVAGRDDDHADRLDGPALQALAPPADAQAYVCGPGAFMDEITAALAAAGIDPSHIHTEPFGPAPSQTPGIAAAPACRAPARPSRSPAATSRSPGPTATPACWSWPRPATSPCAGRAARACATRARRPSSRAPSATDPTPSSPPRRAARSSAARSPATTSCSTSDA